MSLELYNYDEETGSWIAKDFRHGKNFQHGLNCIIDPDVVVGDDVRLGHAVHLKSGTRILTDVEIADHCQTTGICIIGNHVRIRTGSCISRSVIIDDWVFVGAGIMSSHTKHVHHGRPKMEKRQLVTRIGYAAIIGSRANLMAGVTIAPGAIVGYNSNVVGDLEQYGVYFNRPHPWATLQTKLESDDPWYVKIPDGYEPHQFDEEMLKKYLPFCKLALR
jgi:acetyltransferase-like isoleucine patch superfamily enzyme